MPRMSQQKHISFNKIECPQVFGMPYPMTCMNQQIMCYNETVMFDRCWVTCKKGAVIEFVKDKLIARKST